MGKQAAWVKMKLHPHLYHHHHHHHQFNTHECRMNNKIHDRTHTIIQKDTKRQITQTKPIQKNKTKNCLHFLCCRRERAIKVLQRLLTRLTSLSGGV